MQYNISCFHFSPPMEDQYGMPDLRHYITSRPLFPPLPQPPDLLRPTHPYDMLIFRSDSTTNAGAASSSGAAGGGCFGGFESGGLNDGGTGRWPRQETLTLLEIRSRLDPKFKEANQKGPLWDEVSRILSEEHGYQRSGKKCREKFENLYKYYKKTKEGKAGRQDGKHYRFFRQLEALYGDNNVINTPASVSENHLLGGCNLHSNFHVKNQETGIQGGDTSLSLSNYSDEPDDTSVSSEDLSNDTGMKKKKKRGGGRMGWKVKIRDFIDTQMKKLMEKQEAWMEKMMRAIENKEQDRMMREEEWRKQDALRIEREHKFWASERAWIEARDAALMEALHKLTGKEQAAAEIHSMSGNQNNDDGSDQTMNNSAMWPEGEINRLIQLRSGMEGRFQERGGSEGGELWEEISAKMGCFGHERSGIMCRDKWDSVNNYLLKCNKKRKENSKSCNYNYHHNQGGGGVYNCESQHGGGGIITSLNHDHHRSSSPNNNTTANAMSDSCFRYFMGDTYGRIMD